MTCKTKIRLLGALLISIFLGLSGCGSDGADGKDADPAVLADLQAQIDALNEAKDVKPEACVICHDDSGSLAKSGAQHQADYEEFYQDQALRVVNLNYVYTAPVPPATTGTDTVTFDMAKKDEFGIYQNFDCRLATSNPEPDVTDALGINFVQYDPVTREFSDGAASTFWKPIKGTLTYDGNGGCTSTSNSNTLGDLSLLNGHIAVYGRDETLPSNSAGKLDNPKFPFAAMIKTGVGTDYVSLANASGCENCHTRPFLKHAYIYGEVSENVTDLAVAGNDGNDFYVCKTCHLDQRNGRHEDWQLLKDNPTRHAALHELAEAAAAQVPPDTTKDSIRENMDAAELAKYAYKTRLMNDLHMSHNMEFGYPQSMLTCNTCHAGKLVETLATENYTAETCISCHAVDKLIEKMTTNRLGVPITVHNNFIDTPANLKAATCNACHSPPGFLDPLGNPYPSAGVGPEFTDIHTGYDPEIYTSDGTKYSEALEVSVDSALFDAATNILTIEFSAAELDTNGDPDTAALADYDAEDIVPLVIIGPYGYDTKHYIVGPHNRDENRNRLLEYELVGNYDPADHPRITEVDTGDPTTWEVTVDMSMWADMIADGTIRRLEIGVMPELGHKTLTTLDRSGNPVPLVLAMNAPSRTFDLTSALPDGTATDTFVVEDDVVDVQNGCNSCHDALATTFHSANRGGNIKICKMCHVPSSAGSHLEMQSRSIDSYVHAVHSFQVFDIGDIDIADPVEAAEHDHKLSAEFPRFGVKNCESCHVPFDEVLDKGTYGVPDQSKSLPSLHAGSDDTQFERNINDVPRYVMGPASRACGACHRAQMLRADDANKLAAFNEHVKTFGYLVEDGDGVWDEVVKKIMLMFE